MRKKESKFYYARVRPDLLGLPNTRVRRIEQHSIVGDPDVDLCVNGWSVDIELKKDVSSKPRPLQVFNVAETVRAGGYGFIAHPGNWSDIYKFLRLLANTKHSKKLEVPVCLKLPTEILGTEILT